MVRSVVTVPAAPPPLPVPCLSPAAVLGATVLAGPAEDDEEEDEEDRAAAQRQTQDEHGGGAAVLVVLWPAATVPAIRVARACRVARVRAAHCPRWCVSTTGVRTERSESGFG